MLDTDLQCKENRYALLSSLSENDLHWPNRDSIFNTKRINSHFNF